MKTYNIKAFLIRIVLFFLCPKYAILNLNITRSNEGKLEAFIFFRKRGIRLFKKLSTSIQWNAYMESNGIAYMEYSTAGDINYHTLDVSLDKYMSTGKDPENVCYRLLKKMNIHPDVFTIQQEHYYKTHYDKMPVEYLIGLSEVPLDDNPIFNPSYLNYLDKFREYVKKETARNLPYKKTKRFSNLWNALEKCTDEVNEENFALVCWAQELPCNKAALYFKNQF